MIEPHLSVVRLLPKEWAHPFFTGAKLTCEECGVVCDLFVVVRDNRPNINQTYFRYYNEDRTRHLTIGHIIPLGKGGAKSAKLNARVLCDHCNQQEGATFIHLHKHQHLFIHHALGRIAKAKNKTFEIAGITKINNSVFFICKNGKKYSANQVYFPKIKPIKEDFATKIKPIKEDFAKLWTLEFLSNTLQAYKKSNAIFICHAHLPFKELWQQRRNGIQRRADIFLSRTKSAGSTCYTTAQTRSSGDDCLFNYEPKTAKELRINFLQHEINSIINR